MKEYKLNINKSEIVNKDIEALACELGFYIGTKKEIDEYIKKNIIEKCDYNADEYFVFYMFCKFVVDKFFDSEVQDIYSLIDYNYIRLVGMFLNEYCVENKEDDLLGKVNKIIENKNIKEETEKNSCLEDIENCYYKVKKYFDMFDKDMELIKTCFNGGVADFHRQYENRLCKVEKYGEQKADCFQIARLGYNCTISADNKMEDIRLFSKYESDKMLKFTSIKKEFKVCYKDRQLFLISNIEKDLKIDLKNVDINNEFIQNNYKEFAFVCRGFENIVKYLEEIEDIVRYIVKE